MVKRANICFEYFNIPIYRVMDMQSHLKIIILEDDIGFLD